MKPFPLLLTLLLAAGTLRAQQDQTVTITSGGRQRAFDIHLPSNAPAANLPLLLCYHGSGQTSAGIQISTGFNPLAEPNNFIVVYPQSLTIGGDLQWNVYVDDKPGHGGIAGADDAPDDVMFTRDVINYMATNYAVDRGRVYATGLSNGAFMCYALAMLAPNDIAAIAPVAGNLWADNAYLAQLEAAGTVRPIPVMHIHGTSDNVVDYPDPDDTPKPYEEYPLFVAARGCSATTYSSVVPIMNGVDKLVFCPPPVEVSLIRIKDMTHAWTNGVYPTSTEIVKFFGLAAPTSGVAELGSRGVSVEPNPANTFVRVDLPAEATVQLFSLLGEGVYAGAHGTGPLTIPCGDLPAGLYLLRIMPADGGGAATRWVVVTH
jgi:poly(3-hydroxybutyrate) depolymerase